MLAVSGKYNQYPQLPSLNQTDKAYAQSTPLPSNDSAPTCGFNLSKFYNEQKALGFAARSEVRPNYTTGRNSYISNNREEGFFYSILLEDLKNINFGIFKQKNTNEMDLFLSNKAYITLFKNEPEKNKKNILSTILDTAINQAEKEDCDKLVMLKSNKELATTLYDTAREISDRFKEDDNALYLDKKDFKAVRAELKEFFAQNIEKVGKLTNEKEENDFSKRFSSSVIHEIDFKKDRHPEFTDKDSNAEVYFVKSGQNIYIENKYPGKPVKIINSTEVNNTEVKIKPGQAVALGNNVYLFDHNEKTNNYELRLLSKDGPDKFTKIYGPMIAGEDFKQHGLSDCYFLSAVKALSLKPKGKELISKMIKPIKSKEGEKYRVRFPGYRHASLVVDAKTFTNDYDLEVEGPKYLKILEDAYSQLRERLNWHEPEFAKPDNKDDWLNGGYASDALYVLSGNYNKKDKIDDKEEFKSQMKYLKDNIKDFALCMAIITDGFTSTSSQGELYEKQGHAYTISDIFPEKEEIEIINPHDTSKKHLVSYDDVLRSEDKNSISYIYLNNDPTPPVEKPQP